MALFKRVSQSGESDTKKEAFLRKREEELKDREINLRSRERNLEEQVAKFQTIIQSKEDIERSKEKILDRIALLKKEEHNVLEKLAERKEQLKSVRLDIDAQLKKFETNEKGFLERIDELHRLEKDLLEKEQLLGLKEKVLKDKEAEIVRREKAASYLEEKSEKLAKEWGGKVTLVKEQLDKLAGVKSGVEDRVRDRQKELSRLEGVLKNKGMILSELKRQRRELNKERETSAQKSHHLHVLEKALRKQEKKLDKRLAGADRQIAGSKCELERILMLEKEAEKRIYDKRSLLKEIAGEHARHEKLLASAKEQEHVIEAKQKALFKHEGELDKQAALLSEKSGLLKKKERELEKCDEEVKQNALYMRAKAEQESAKLKEGAKKDILAKKSEFEKGFRERKSALEHELASRKLKLEKEFGMKSSSIKSLEQDIRKEAALLSVEKAEVKKAQDILKNYTDKIVYFNKIREDAVRGQAKLSAMAHDLAKQRTGLSAEKAALKKLEKKIKLQERELRRNKVAWLGREDQIQKSREELGAILKNLRTAVEDKKAELLNMREMSKSKIQLLAENKSFVREELKKLAALKDKDLAIMREKEAELLQTVEKMERERQKLLGEEKKIVDKSSFYEAALSRFNNEKKGLEKKHRDIVAKEKELQKGRLELQKERELARAERQGLAEQRERLKKAVNVKKGFLELERQHDLLEKEIEKERAELKALSLKVAGKEKALRGAPAEEVFEEPAPKPQKQELKTSPIAEFDSLMNAAKEALGSGNLNEATRLAVELELICGRIKDVERSYDVEELKINIKLASLR